MKIQSITPQQNINKRNNNVNFTGIVDGATQALRFLDTNQAWGATAVDLGSMVVPRTVVDMSRSPQAGFETLSRESSGATNHALIGIYGLGAGALVAQALNKDYGLSTQNIFASNDALDIMGQAWHKEIQNKSADPLKRYLNTVFDSVSGHGNKLSEQDKDIVVNTLYSEIKDGKKLSKNAKSLVHSTLTGALGTENDVMIKAADGRKSISSAKTLVEDLYSVTKAFMNKNVSKAFEKAGEFSKNDFVHRMKNMNLQRSALGLAVAAAVGVATQPLNVYISKKRTGTDGFVGVEGRKKDNSLGFKAMKTAVAAGFAALSMKVIGGTLKDLPKKVQFKGSSPTLNQFKLVYGLTIMSRVMTSRDKDELRETTVKDSLGYVNWLVLGNFVTKAVAKVMDKDLVKSFDNKAKGFAKFLKSEVVTRDEVVLAEMKKNGIATVKDGKALNFKQMLKALPEGSLAKTKINKLNAAQLAGYVYSGLVLGWGIPKLNIAITEHSDKKRAEKKKGLMFNPVNMAFLNKKINNSQNISLK